MYSGTPHKGLDIGVPYGTPIYASESGQVLSAEYHWSWGHNVLIWHNGTYSTRYAHCSSLAVSAGQYVEKGQVIGYVGSTGPSSGPHLHIDVYQNAPASTRSGSCDFSQAANRLPAYGGRFFRVKILA